MQKDEVLARIKEIGIIPAIRVASLEDAVFAAESIAHEIPVAELTMTVPGAIEVIALLAKKLPEMIVGAGTVMDLETAQRALDAGARFLTCTGLDLNLVEFALSRNIAVFPGALTPTEVMNAWRSGADLVKIFPCAPIGGPNYIRVLKAPFPDVPMIASGGVNQQTAAEFILAGSAVLGVGAELIPQEAVHRRQPDWIQELGKRFTDIVKHARQQLAARHADHKA
jgi:2-dehydro-3-deoxyphosphogluconate aldolase/(4S)-4-hydroxy-2-oxoglutarate aldolase